MASHRSSRINLGWISAPEKPYVASVIVFCALLMLLTFNRTAPITEGWFSTYADMILDGKVPYRDFELVLPPLYTYMVAAVNFVFGNYLIVWRIIGMLLFIGTGLLAYRIFRLLFPAWVSAVSAITAMIASFADGVFVSYDYINFFSFFAFLVFYESLRLLTDLYRGIDTDWKRFFYVGLLCGITFLFRQSSGLIIFVFLTGCFIFISALVKKIPVSKKDIVAFVIGTAAPVILILLCLAFAGAAGDCLEMLFSSGVKGNVSDMATGFLARTFNKRPEWALAGILAALGTVYFRRFLVNDWHLEWSRIYLITSVTMTVIVTVILVCSDFRMLFAENATGQMNLPALAFTFTLTLFLLTFVKLLKDLRSKIIPNIDLIKYLFFSGFLTMIAIGGGLSADITYRHTYVALGFITAVFLSIVCKLPLKGLSYHKTGVVLVSAIIIAVTAPGMMADKADCSYSWFVINTEPYENANCTTDIDYFTGIMLTPAEKSFYEDFVALSDRYLDDEDIMYCYSPIPVFYTLAGKTPTVTAAVPWFDVASDKAVLDDLAYLHDNNPKMIVFADHGEETMRYEEDLYRNGHDSGQRAMYNWICECMNGNYGYVNVATYLIQDYVVNIIIKT